MAAERARRAAADRERELARARQHERARIAREMHDVLGHRLSLVSMHAGALEYRPDASPDEIAAAAGVVRRSAHQALQDLREVIAVLRDEPDADGSRPQPTLADLPALLEESREAGVRLRADWGGLDLAAVPDLSGRAAYRIVQEALTNVRTHAPGVVASLRVGGAPGLGVTVEVSNPLPLGGVRPRAGGGTGLVGLAERAELAGGRIEHGPTSDATFRVAATLPWPL
jgi:signal transduction histidine kinase